MIRISNYPIYHKFLIIICFGVFWGFNSGYSLAEYSPVSPEEMETTFQNIEHEPTNSQSFMRRVQILDQWCGLLMQTVKADAVKQVIYPGWAAAVIDLKKSGKEKEAFLEVDRLYKAVKEIEMPQKQSGDPYASDHHTPLAAKSTQIPDGVYDEKKTVSPVTATATVDFAKPMGPFSPYLFGAISGPYFDETGFELTKKAGFRLVGVFLDATKPLPANVNDPSQYDFSLLDKQVEAIIRIGAEPMIIFAPISKPSDLNKYSLYVQNIVKHLTKGWGNGHRWSVKLFRFGSEPDNLEFWKDTQYSFFETYTVWANAVKAVDTKYILIAPSLMRVRIDFQSQALHPWVNNFLDYCNKTSTPVDYFSFHAYSPIPYHFFHENTKLLVSEIKNYPGLSPLYGIPRIANDEWQIKTGDLWSGMYSQQFDTAWAATHNITVLINMISQGLELSVPMTGAFNGGEKGCHDFLLVDCHNRGKPSFHAFQGFNWLYGTDRLSASGTDQMNFAVTAGKTRNGVIIVFSNYDIAGYFEKFEPKTGPSAWHEYHHHISERGIPNIYNRFAISTVNLPWQPSDTVVFEHYLVDDTHQLALVESEIVSGNQIIDINGEMTSPSVHVIKMFLK